MTESSLWPDEHTSIPFGYLTTMGRASGKPHRIEIWFAVEEGRVYLLSGGRDRSDWVRNLMVNPVVTMEIGDEQRTGVAHVMEAGTAHDTRARELLVAKYQKGSELVNWGRNSLGVLVLFDTESAAD